MEKEIISQKQGISMMTLYLLGSTLVLGVGGEAEKDVWLVILISMLLAVPTFFVYARILAIFPGKDLYQIAEETLGKAAGIAVAILYAWFSFHLGALVLRNFTEFIQVVSMPETPQPAMAILMTALCIWGVKAGIEVVGRWSSIVFPVVIITIVGVTSLTIPMFNFNNLKPVLYDGMRPVLDSAFSVFAFPFAETFLFMMALPLNRKGNTYKVYYWSLFIGGVIILLVSVRNLLVMGAVNISIHYFSSYITVRLINIGEFLQRIEVLVSVVFLFAGFVKATICLHVSCKGISQICRFVNFKQIAAPVGVLMMVLSVILYTNTMEMFEWANKIYKYYILPFAVVIPVIILIAAEIRKRRLKKKEEKQAA